MYNTLYNHIHEILEFVPNDIYNIYQADKDYQNLVLTVHNEELNLERQRREFDRLLSELREYNLDSDYVSQMKTYTDTGISNAFPLLISNGLKSNMMESLRQTYNDNVHIVKKAGSNAKLLKYNLIFILQLGGNIRDYLKESKNLMYTPRFLFQDYTLKNIVSRSVLRRLYNIEGLKEYLDNNYKSTVYERYKALKKNRLTRITVEELEDYLEEFGWKLY